jgi:hypothetical protein
MRYALTPATIQTYLVQSSTRRKPDELPNVPGGQFSGVSTPAMQYPPNEHSAGDTVASPQKEPAGHSAQSICDRAPGCAR